MDAPTPDNPVQFDDSKAKAMVGTVARDLGIIVTFVTAILGLASRHDLRGIISFLQTEQGVSAASLLLGIGLSIFRAWKARRTVTIVKAAVQSNPADPSVILKGDSNV